MSAQRNLPVPAGAPSVPQQVLEQMRVQLETPSPYGVARMPVLVGVGIFLFAIVGSLVWGALAPLASAAMAPGQVIVESKRKTIQHFEGGIIGALLVDEGDIVEAGDPLVELDNTQSQAMLDVVRSQYVALKAQEVRLQAERDGLDRIDFSHSIFSEEGVGGQQQAIDGQTSIFSERRKALQSQLDIVGQRVKQLKDQITGLQAQAEANDQQYKLIQEELKGVNELYQQGYERKTRVLALQRAMASIAGERGEYLAGIAEARQRIGEAELSALDARTRYMNEVVAQLGEVQARIADLEERLRAMRDRADRTVIRAPNAGIIVNMRVHTVGGVVPPGGELMDIVPSDDELVIEAMLRPEDIDEVHPGLPAEVRITAFHTRSTPPLDGEVVRVSADTLVNTQTGVAFYKARVRLHPESIEKLGDLKLYPGMPAEVMIKTGSRTALQIAFSPIIDSMNRSFREK